MPRVLIADDNQQNAELLEAHLDGSAYETRIAINGDDTLKIAKEWNPDAILLDVMMPKLSGFEVCKRLRASEATRSIGVVMVTAARSEDRYRTCHRRRDGRFPHQTHQPHGTAAPVESHREARTEKTDADRGLAYFRRVLQGV